MLFESVRKEGVVFFLFDKINEDLYDMVRQNIIGGLSIIFMCYYEIGKLYICGNLYKLCGKIIGFDVNVFYLYCLGKDMFVGVFVCC